MPAERVCSTCGAALPAGAPGGQCVRCLFQFALQASGQEPASILERASGLAGYELQEEIGRGGMGSVHRATDQNLPRDVAVKLMGGGSSAEDRARFEREAHVLARLEHPNIVPIHRFGMDGEGQPFYTMKLVHGITLAAVLNALAEGEAETLTRFSLPELLNIFQKICDAIGFAHSKGVIHRDLKPANVMIGAFGEVLVMDWGLAKILGEQDHAGSAETEAVSSPELTMEGRVLGTPTAMAPEQASGRTAEHNERTDIFGLGTILYRMLTLRSPVGGSSIQEVLVNAMRGYIPPPVLFNSTGAVLGSGDEGRIPLAHCPDGKIPPALSAVAMKALSVQQEDRYQTVAELQGEITAYQNGFATAAEQAGPVKQFTLLLRRHKAFTITAGIALLAATGFLAKIVASERRANSTLARLKATAPVLHSQTLASLNDGKLDEALARISDAISLVPQNPEYRRLQGNLFQDLLRFDDARRAYEKALKLNPEDELSEKARSVSVALSQHQSTNGPLVARLKQLHALAIEQKRSADAVVLFRALTDEQRRTQGASAKASRAREERRAALYETWKLQLARGRLEPVELAVIDDDTIRLVLNGPSVTTIEALRGMPLADLNLPETRILDLEPLRAAPLRRLDLNSTRVADISMLTVSNLEYLDLRQTFVTNLDVLAHAPLKIVLLNTVPVADLGPLTGAPLVSLDIGATKVKDLAPLRGMPLTSLLANNTGVSNLNPLAQSPLTNLNLSACQRVRDLGPLAGMRLISLNIFGCAVTNLEPLRGMPLSSLNLGDVLVGNLAPLKGMRLGFLNLNNCPAKDLSPLQGMPLTNLVLRGAKARDLSPLASCPIQSLDISESEIADLRPLSNCPLTSLVASRFVADLTPLRGLPIESLSLRKTKVTNLAALAGMPLKELDLAGTGLTSVAGLTSLPVRRLDLADTKVTDVSPLLKCPALRTLILPATAQNFAVLRSHPTLAQISFTDTPYVPEEGFWRSVMSASNFWKKAGAAGR